MTYIIDMISEVLKDPNYWYAFLSAVLGVAIGAFVSYLNDLRILRADRKRKINALKSSLRQNIGLILKAQDFYSPGSKQLPNFLLDGASLGNRIAACADIIDDETLKKLEWNRYQIDHLSFKIQISVLNPEVEAPEHRPLRYAEILRHLKETELALDSIDRSLSA